MFGYRTSDKARNWPPRPEKPRSRYLSGSSAFKDQQWVRQRSSSSKSRLYSDGTSISANPIYSITDKLSDIANYNILPAFDYRFDLTLLHARPAQDPIELIIEIEVSEIFGHEFLNNLGNAAKYSAMPAFDKPARFDIILPKSLPPLRTIQIQATPNLTLVEHNFRGKLSHGRGKGKEWRASQSIRTQSGAKVPLNYIVQHPKDWALVRSTIRNDRPGRPDPVGRRKKARYRIATDIEDAAVQSILKSVPNRRPRQVPCPRTHHSEKKLDQSPQEQSALAHVSFHVAGDEQRVENFVLPYESFCGAVLDKLFQLQSQIREENHCIVYEVSSLEDSEEKLEAKAFLLQGIPKRLREARKRTMSRVKGVIHQTKQGCKIFLVYRPSPRPQLDPKADGRSLNPDHVPGIRHFPRIGEDTMSKTEASRKRQKARRQLGRGPSGTHAGSSQQDMYLSSARDDDENTKKGQESESWAQIVQSTESFVGLGSRDFHNYVTQPKWPWRRSSTRPKHLIPGHHLPLAISTKEKECDFIKVQLEIVQQAIQFRQGCHTTYHRVPCYLGAYKTRELLSTESAMQNLLLAELKELGDLRGKLSGHQDGSSRQEAIVIFELEGLVTLRSLEELSIPHTPQWNELQSKLAISMESLGISKSELDVLSNRWDEYRTSMLSIATRLCHTARI